MPLHRFVSQDLQAEVNDLKRKEAELRALLSEVAGSAAAQHLTKLDGRPPPDLPSGDALSLVQQLNFVQRAKSYAQSLQVLHMHTVANAFPALRPRKPVLYGL